MMILMMILMMMMMTRMMYDWVLPLLRAVRVLRALDLSFRVHLKSDVNLHIGPILPSSRSMDTSSNILWCLESATLCCFSSFCRVKEDRCVRVVWIKMMETVCIRCPQIYNISNFGQLFSEWRNRCSGCCNYCFRHKGGGFLDCNGGGDGGLLLVLGLLMLVVFSRVFIGNLTPENGVASRRCHHF